MVVVSDSWVKNVATFPTPAMNETEMIIPNNETKMTAKAVLICRHNSHPFQDRTLTLDEPVKVGRSVARARAKPNNAIFDCKVLSRNHAIIWYENGKFFLQDTKSSNGTFVNNNKLIPDTEHHEVSSGVIVQFGVDVVENNRKVTHGCIIATLKLYLPDGKEAKASPSITENNRLGMVPLDELYRLNQIIQDACDREECLQKKLTKLQDMLQTAKVATNSCWATYVGEERLLSRIATLETQLSQANKNWTEDRCKQELTKIQDENVAYQVAAIEALEKLHTEKLDAVAYVTELEIKENAIQQESNLNKIQIDALQKEMNSLLQNLITEQKKTEQMRTEYETKINNLEKELDFKNHEVVDLEVKLDSLRKNNSNNMDEVKDSVENELICVNDMKIKQERMDDMDHEEEQKHITLTVGPVEQTTDSENEDISLTNLIENQQLPCHQSTDTLMELPLENIQKDVKFTLPEDEESKNSEDDEIKEKASEDETEEEKEIELVDHIDSKTLKYHFQTQNDLKKQIEELHKECKLNQTKVEELEELLSKEKKSLTEIKESNEELKIELNTYKGDLDKSNKENIELKTEINNLITTKEIGAGDKNDTTDIKKTKIIINESFGGKMTNYDELVLVEEELVILKERYSQVNKDKIKLQHDLDDIKKDYNAIRNQSHNMTFFYIAPLILVLLYLLLSKMFS